MAISSESRFAPPSATVADMEPEAGGLPLATRGRRLGAVTLDGLINGAGSILVLFLVGRSAFTTPPSMGLAYLATNMLIGTAVFVLINGWLLFDRGQTVGKALLGIRIVRPDGSKVGLGRLALRYGFSNVLTIVPMIGAVFGLTDALMIFRKSVRCLHDQIADTIVIRV